MHNNFKCINPIINLFVKTDSGESRQLPFLVDSGAEMSFINLASIRDAVLNKEPCREYITGFGSDRSYDRVRIKVDLTMPNSEQVSTEIFALPELQLNVNVRGITSKLNQLRAKGVPISTNVPNYSSDFISLAGIIGNDLLPLIGVFKYSKVESSFLVRLSNGFIPVGLLSNVKIKVAKNDDSDFSQIVGEDSFKSNSLSPYVDGFSPPLKGRLHSQTFETISLS